MDEKLSKELKALREECIELVGEFITTFIVFKIITFPIGKQSEEFKRVIKRLRDEISPEYKPE